MPDDNPRTGVLQRDKRSYAIVPRLPLGVVTPEILESVAAVAREFGLVVKITSGQRLALIGMTEDQVEPVWQKLGAEVGHPVGLCVHYVQACPGTQFCRFGVQDSLGLGSRLEKLFAGVELPAKTKIGVSGCPLNCAESWVRDIGVFGAKKGWKVVVGGNSGNKPRIGNLIAKNLDDDQVVGLLERIFDYYRATAGGKDRMPRFIEKTGLAELEKAVLEEGTEA